MAENNTLNEWSDGEDDWIFDINENNVVDDSDLLKWSDSEADDIIRNMIVDDSEWSNPELDSMDVDELTNPGTDDVIHIVQTGRGKKRKSDEPLLPERLLRNRECEKPLF